MNLSTSQMEILLSMCARYELTRDDLITGHLRHMTPSELVKAGVGKHGSTADMPANIVLGSIIQNMLLRGYLTKDGVPGLIVDLFAALDIPLEKVVTMLAALALTRINKGDTPEGDVVAPEIVRQADETAEHYSLRKALHVIGKDVSYEALAGMVIETATLKQLCEKGHKAA